MLSDNKDYQKHIINNIIHLQNKDLLPLNHCTFLEKLYNEYNFVPEICYDIGAAVLHWTRHAERIWPNTKIYLFDGFSPLEICYDSYDYTIAVLSDLDNKQVKYYQNDYYFAGNSYYKEKTNNIIIFPENNYLIKYTRSLDSIVKEKNYKLPDLIKIDVQGAELDIIKGAEETLKHAKYLLVELQDIEYNEGAPLAHITIEYLKSIGWICIAEKFSDNGPDADYCFMNTNK